MGTKDRARHIKAQVCFSIGIQVTKPGMSLSSFIPGPQGIPCSPSFQVFLLSWNISLPNLSYCFHTTSSVNCSLMLGPPWALLPQLPQHPQSPLRAHVLPSTLVVQESQFITDSRHASQPCGSPYSPRALQQAHDQGSVRVGGHVKGATDSLSSACGPIPGRTAPASGGGATSTGRGAGQAAPASDRGTGRSQASRGLVASV